MGLTQPRMIFQPPIPLKQQPQYLRRRQVYYVAQPRLFIARQYQQRRRQTQLRPQHIRVQQLIQQSKRQARDQLKKQQ